MVWAEMWCCLPQDIIARVGADTVRLFVLFKAPPEADILWDTKGAASWMGGHGQ